MSSLIDQARSVITSPLVQSVILIGITATLSGRFIVSCAEALASSKSLFPIFLSRAPLLLFLGISVAASFFWKRKQIENEWGSTENIFKNWLDPIGYPWWSSLIEKKLVVGALPMESKNHKEELKKMGITHILSVVEDHEFEPRTFYKPVRHEKTEENWLQLKSPDYEPPSVKVIEEGVAWIHSKVKAGGNVYVHCKSGKGRSVAIAVAYAIEHGFKQDAELAKIIEKNRERGTLEVVKAVFQYVKGIRPQVSNSNKLVNQVVTYLENLS